MIAEEYRNMSSANHSVLATSNNIHGAHDKYNKYSEKIRRSQLLVEEIQKAERWDELKLRYSFNFFLFTAAYLLAKRFFLWETIYLLYYLVLILYKYTTEFILLPLIQGSTV